jgi:hypothetical protein
LYKVCLEGINGIDPHIGGEELHQKCYYAVNPKWLEWSRGYDVPLERTTLRGRKVHAPIAGKALSTRPAKRDAIWDFFYKIRGRATEPTFKAEQIDLYVVIEPEDFECAEQRREQLKSDADNITVITTTNVSKYDLILFIWPI